MLDFKFPLDSAYRTFSCFFKSEPLNDFPFWALVLSQTMDGINPVRGEFTLVSGVTASAPLAYNASASEVAEAINTMKTWEGLILVERQEVTDQDNKNPANDMFEWRLTFSPAEGNVPEIGVRPLGSPLRFH